jgi:hypothetical protein
MRKDQSQSNINRMMIDWSDFEYNNNGINNNKMNIK